MFDLILDKALSNVDRAKVYGLRMKLYQVAGKYDDGVTVALEALRLFGVMFPESDEDIQVAAAAELAAVPINLRGRPISELVDAPLTTDGTVQAIINLLVEAMPCAYIGRPKLEHAGREFFSAREQKKSCIKRKFLCVKRRTNWLTSAG